jgi:cell division protein FtsQ
MEKIEKEEQQKKQKKKKSHRLYAGIVLILMILIVILGILVLFYTQKIQVEGNEYCDTKEIEEAVLGNEYEINTLYIVGKYALNKGEVIPCMESMKVRLANPWTLKVTVEEKEIVGYAKDNNKYAYFDKDGLIVKISEELIEGLPSIEGIELKDIKLYQNLKSDNSKLFQEILETFREVNKYALATDKIECKNDAIYLYIGDICVALGSSISSEQIAQIEPIIAKLAGQKGTLHLENYSSTTKTITFEKQKETEEDDKDSTDDTASDTAEDDSGTEDTYTEDDSDVYTYTWDGTDLEEWDDYEDSSDTYDSTYDDTYDSTYDSTYDDTYDSTYDDSYDGYDDTWDGTYDDAW